MPKALDSERTSGVSAAAMATTKSAPTMVIVATSPTFTPSGSVVSGMVVSATAATSALMSVSRAHEGERSGEAWVLGGDRVLALEAHGDRADEDADQAEP